MLAQLDRLIARIAQNSEQFPMFEFATRRAVLHKFPYFVVFREATAGIEIVAVAHGRRPPGLLARPLTSVYRNSFSSLPSAS